MFSILTFTIMNIIMTTSGYILRLKDLISNKIMNLVGNNQNEVASAMSESSSLTEETALHALLDQGKSFREAELIIATIKEWDLPLESVFTMSFEVHGDSVWIKGD